MSDDNKFPEPLGNNQLSAYAMFEQRKYYKDIIYPSDFEVPSPIDLWYSRPLFGKVNTNGDAIYTPKTYLKEIGNNVWALDFVVDAFNDFKTEFLFLNKKAVEGTPYALLKPSRGWDSALNLYDSYMDEVYEAFINFIDTNQAHNNLATFGEFMDVFYRFIDNASPNVPITLSQFILSRNCPATISGMMIDISTDTHGNDVDKFNHFLNNDNFVCFVETAERFGFKVDKNFPGRLIVDIRSPVMCRAGDPSIPPSLGGMGYILRYPKQPTMFTTPPPAPPIPFTHPPPPQQDDNPFSVGDRIAVAATRFENRDDGYNYQILKNHTLLENRIQEPGYRTKKYNNSNVLDLLRNTYAFQEEKIPIYGTIVSFNPTVEEGTLYFGGGYTQPNEPSVIINMSVMTGELGTSPSGIWHKTREVIRAIELNDLGTLKIEPDYVYKHNYNPPNISEPGMYVELPLSAIHLKNDNPSFVVTRFKNRLNYPSQLQKYRRQKDAADKLYQSKRVIYDTQTLPEWERLKQRSESAWEFYENPNNQLTLTNLFRRRYKDAAMDDIIMLKEICVQFYYSYVSINPTTTITKVIPCGGPNSYISKRSVVKREQISQSLIREKYDDPYWLKQYILFQNAQSLNKYSFDTLRIIRKRAVEIYTQMGFTTAINYIKSQMIKEQTVSTMPLAKFKK